ncbi:AraC family transcriptional regulator protein (plasmid) [Rhizobium etli]|uniref:AraC family transcriptional regulator protein n=1 Tax=Rhizobium etli TaxID=29449 RepID=A0AAN1BN86_RHIET|nr:AraC family transcriptional regulator [Rhizobium etli]AGS25926.1 AraC family transcriptional regulator protein [Rhizobium etli bv. mimosae str. Mim1]ARQ14344.1 AraC family transcriptional regulator protein [Rhizobium etli]
MIAAANTVWNVDANAGTTLGALPATADADIAKLPAFFPNTANEVVRGGLAPWQYKKVLNFVEEHLSETVKIDELADLVRLSGSHFSRAFRATVGQSPYDYVLSRRMAFAKELMATTDASLSQIALECGMSDQAHLCKVFRRTFGTTPNAWRKPYRVAVKNTLH